MLISEIIATMLIGICIGLFLSLAFMRKEFDKMLTKKLIEEVCKDERRS